MEDFNMTVNHTLYPFLHLELSPNDSALPTSPWILPNATSAPDVLTAPSGDELEHPILLGAFAIGVVVMILLLMIVVLRYIAHQKGSYYTHEEALAFKSNPEMQDVPESLEDLEEEEP